MGHADPMLDAQLQPYWMPFTANRQFKAAPRMLVGAKDMIVVEMDDALLVLHRDHAQDVRQVVDDGLAVLQGRLLDAEGAPLRLADAPRRESSKKQPRRGGAE